MVPGRDPQVFPVLISPSKPGRRHPAKYPYPFAHPLAYSFERTLGIYSGDIMQINYIEAIIQTL